MTFPLVPLSNQWVAGPPYEEIDSIKMNTRVDAQLNALRTFYGTGAWITYTTSWTAASVNPALGNGGIYSAYQQVGSKILKVMLYCAFGSTTTFGTGSWAFSLPGGFTSFSILQSGMAGVAFDNSTGLGWVVSASVPASQTKFNVYPARDAGSFVCDSARPFTWAVSDALYLSGEIQIA